MRTTRSACLASVFGLGLGLGLVGLPGTSHADTTTFVQTSDHCTGLCGTNTLNTVTISDVGQTAGTIDIKVSLAAGWSFINTGAGDATFAFSSSLSNLGLAIQSDTTSFSTWSTVGPVASLHMDGLTFPTSAYGANTTLGPNNSTGNNLLDFTVHAAGLTFASFMAALENATNAGGQATTALFAADVFSPKTGCTGAGTTCTGIIDWSTSVSQVPLPPAALLFGTALVGMGVLGRRRRKNGSALAA